MEVNLQKSQYNVKEAVFDQFHSQGEIVATISGGTERFSPQHEISVTHDFRVADAATAEDAMSGEFSLDWDGLALARLSSYRVDEELVEYVVRFDLDEDGCNLSATGEPIDVAASNLFDNSPFKADPQFLLPTRDPEDGPPSIRHREETKLERGASLIELYEWIYDRESENEAYSTSWESPRKLADALSRLGRTGDPGMKRTPFSKVRSDLEHIGGGRPALKDIGARPKAAFCRHEDGGHSLGVWLPYQPINSDNIWSIAQELGAAFVTAIDVFPTKFQVPVPPEIWNTLPRPVWQLHQTGDEDRLYPCAVQITYGVSNRYPYFDLW